MARGEGFREVIVIPAKAGIQAATARSAEPWVPAYAGTTRKGNQLNIRLQRVSATLPAAFAALQAEARASGHSMLDTLASEWASGTTRFDRSGEALVAAYVDEALAGIGGLTQEPAIPDALRMRRFYVALAYRRHGVGRALAAALLRETEGRTITCNAAGGSEEFWEALGFAPDRRDSWTHLLAR